MLLQPLDAMAQNFGAVVPAIVVDDLVLQRWGSHQKVDQGLIADTRALVRCLGGAKLRVAIDNSSVLGSSSKLRRNVPEQLINQVGDASAKHARHLGIDRAEGLRAARHLWRRRIQGCKARVPKVQRFLGLRRGRQAAARVACARLPLGDVRGELRGAQRGRVE